MAKLYVHSPQDIGARFFFHGNDNAELFDVFIDALMMLLQKFTYSYLTHSCFWGYDLFSFCCSNVLQLYKYSDKLFIVCRENLLRAMTWGMRLLSISNSHITCHPNVKFPLSKGSSYDHWYYLYHLANSSTWYWYHQELDFVHFSMKYIAAKEQMATFKTPVATTIQKMEFLSFH